MALMHAPPSAQVIGIPIAMRTMRTTMRAIADVAIEYASYSLISGVVSAG